MAKELGLTEEEMDAQRKICRNQNPFVCTWERIVAQAQARKIYEAILAECSYPSGIIMLNTDFMARLARAAGKEKE